MRDSQDTRLKSMVKIEAAETKMSCLLVPTMGRAPKTLDPTLFIMQPKPYI